MIDRGLGLLEVILPHGPAEESGSPLPPGQRDESGFWFPAGVRGPGDIFTADQRAMQAKQRQVQRRRRRPVRGAGDGTMTRRESSGAAHFPPPAAASAAAPERSAAHDPPPDSEGAMPLPAPRFETEVARGAPGARRIVSLPPATLAAFAPSPPAASPRARVVDSKKGSD